MNRRRPMVDFGPMSLPVPDWNESGGELSGCSSKELTRDSLKLESLLAASAAGEAAVEPDSEAQAAPCLVVSDRVSGPASPGLLARSAGVVQAAASGVAAALAHGLAGSGRIRLELDSELLPEASVTVEAGDGGWVFSLQVSDIACLEWLAHELDLLAAEVGPRVGRALEIRLFGANPAPHMICSSSWQPGGSA